MITRRQLLAGILGLSAGPSWCGPQEILAAADVIVVGAGLAGLSAAVSAREAGARRVLILQKRCDDRRAFNHVKRLLQCR